MDASVAAFVPAASATAADPAVTPAVASESDPGADDGPSNDRADRSSHVRDSVKQRPDDREAEQAGHAMDRGAIPSSLSNTAFAAPAEERRADEGTGCDLDEAWRDAALGDENAEYLR